MSEEQDRVFFRNYSLVIGILAVMIVVFIVLARNFGIDDQAYIDQRAESVARTTAPVGKVLIEGQEQLLAEPEIVAETVPEEASPEGAVDTGKNVYNSLCFSCHSTGLPGIPQLGDVEVWADRITRGSELLYERALTGFTGESGIMMPPKGGNPALSDDEIRAAVDFMVDSSQ